ncbi:hypothetical protein SAMD00023353_3600710 [Rosellinia necatrix]|uniref:Uncharacterized protein n=1 Tax=Rosellinia necatrix TaxID=77044 RepID=A0A1W2TN41_ROSNE|nr:hypothetical protein SAMD00023353_3600710 [Rosellinia necatrix]
MSSIWIEDLTDDQVGRITKLLARRPEYGISIPTRKWLQRQEEKIESLPKALLRPSVLRRIAMKIVDSIDPNIVDPQAILCKTHSNLNPFLVRRLFIAIAYEVTVYTDTLRSWPGRSWAFELSAFVGRLDSIAALWTEPELFQTIYGQAPFDSHHIFVQSSCEACCVAAIGANGRALADLRASLVDRIERRKAKASGKEPRLYRVVEAWIDQLRKGGEEKNRADECRKMSEATLVELRRVRPNLQAWRINLKKTQSELRAAQRPVFTQLKRTSSGAQITPLSTAGHHRRTRNGIPIALTDVERAEEHRRAAAMAGDSSESVYRPESVDGVSELNFRQQNAKDPILLGTPTGVGGRPVNPEPPRTSGLSDELPRQSFLNRFGSELPLADDNAGANQRENDVDPMEVSRAKVQQWWTNRLSHVQVDLDKGDAKPARSMVHPAFRPQDGMLAKSAIPAPLDLKKGGHSAATSAVWTDCSVYTLDPDATQQPVADNAPPVPRIPSAFQKMTTEEGRKPGRAPSHAGSSSSSSSSKKKDGGLNTPLNWPAAPVGRIPTPHYDAGGHRGPWAVASSVYSSHDVPSMSHSHGDTIESLSSRGGSGGANGPRQPQPPAVTVETVTENVRGWEFGGSRSDLAIHPDDSASNIGYNNGGRPTSSSYTQLDNFRGKM